MAGKANQCFFWKISALTTEAKFQENNHVYNESSYVIEDIY